MLRPIVREQASDMRNDRNGKLYGNIRKGMRFDSNRLSIPSVKRGETFAHTFDRHQLIDFLESFPSFDVLIKKTRPMAQSVKSAGKRNQNDLKIKMTTASTKNITPYKTSRQTCSLSAPMNPVHGMASKRAKTMVVATHAYLGPVGPPPLPLVPSPQILSASGCVNLIAFSRNSVK